MELEAVRAELPVLDRLAYLNAGTNGPLPRRTVAAMRAVLERLHVLEASTLARGWRSLVDDMVR